MCVCPFVSAKGDCNWSKTPGNHHLRRCPQWAVGFVPLSAPEKCMGCGEEPVLYMSTTTNRRYEGFWLGEICYQNR